MEIHCLNEVVQRYYTVALAASTHITFKDSQIALCEGFNAYTLFYCW